MCWPFERASAVAKEIADEFRAGEIVKSDLNAHGISRMSVRYLGEVVEISWHDPFMSWRPTVASLSVDGRRTLDRTADVRCILDAAYARAKQMFAAELRRLEDKRTKA